MYPDVSPNSIDKLGLVAFYGGSDISPSVVIGDNNGISADNSLLWSLAFAAVGTNAPQVAAWGDYLTIRPDPQNPNGWIAVGYTLQGDH